MKYLNWAIKEALRLNPPVATNAREAVRGTILPTGGGLDGKSSTFVPKGTTIRYQPNSGPRICIGQQFALMQMALITFRLLQASKTIERKDEQPPVRKLGVNTSVLYGSWFS
ncbi:hypothetical protein DL769_004376 [Monosporascus sp. CRB-8-3]|nr:hypothetical protein DL769_004376 [Monosporascus sp. CRB-8-3]